MNARRGAFVVSNEDMTATALGRPASIEEAVLTATDRCGQCGTRAHVRVIPTSGGRLFFCAHYGSKHLTPIASKMSEILDERHLLLED